MRATLHLPAHPRHRTGPPLVDDVIEQPADPAALAGSTAYAELELEPPSEDELIRRAVKELIGHAVNSSNLKSGIHETDTDRLRALARAQAFGSILWRLKYGQQAACWREALSLLRTVAKAQAGNRRLRDPDLWLRLCALVLADWVAGACRTCGDRGYVVRIHSEDEVRWVECKECRGKGRAYTVLLRAVALCAACNGVGSVPRAIVRRPVKPQPCPACGSTAAQDQRQAGRLGVSRGAWDHLWRRRYDRLMIVLRRIDGDTARRVRNSLGPLKIYDL